MIFKKDHLLKRDTWLKKLFYPRKTFWFNNLQDYAPDGSSNLAYNIVINAFWGVSFAATLFLVLILALLLSVAVIMNQMTQFIGIIGYLLQLFPFGSFLLIFIITTVCMYRPLQKIQNQTSIQKNFNFTRFFSVVLIWSILFFGFSSIFGTLSSDTYPEAGCDICGERGGYTLSENGVVIHTYCPLHATYWAFLHPIGVALDPPTHVSYFAHPQIGMPEFTPDDYMVYLSALGGIFTWLFVVSFAFLLGKGYTWKRV